MFSISQSSEDRQPCDISIYVTPTWGGRPWEACETWQKLVRDISHQLSQRSTECVSLMCHFNSPNDQQPHWFLLFHDDILTFNYPSDRYFIDRLFLGLWLPSCFLNYSGLLCSLLLFLDATCQSMWRWYHEWCHLVTVPPGWHVNRCSNHMNPSVGQLKDRGSVLPLWSLFTDPQMISYSCSNTLLSKLKAEIREQRHHGKEDESRMDVWSQQEVSWSYFVKL